MNTNIYPEAEILPAHERTDVILLCGGLGTRLSNITNDTMPKSLFSLAGKELLQYTVEQLDPALIGKLIFAVGHHADQILDWVEANVEDFEVAFSDQITPGIQGAVSSALAEVVSPSVAVCNTDEIRDGFHFDALYATHKRIGASATMLAGISRDLYRHRVLEIDGEIVIDSSLKNLRYIDDHETPGVINTGFLLFQTNKLSDLVLREVADTSWNSLIDPLINSREMAVYLDGMLAYFNVGTPEELMEAEEYITGCVVDRRAANVVDRVS